MKKDIIKQAILLLALGLSGITSVSAQTKITIKPTAMEEVKTFRKWFEGLGKVYPAEKTVTVAPATIGGVPVYWFTPMAAADKRLIVYLHGGSFAVGSAGSHGAMVSHFAHRLQARILFVEYGLAPEKPFPGGINDLVAVYKQLLSSYPGYTIDFIGDSAGGGIVVGAIKVIQAQSLQLPHGAVLISPWLDLSSANASYDTNKDKDPILKKADMQKYAALYAGHTSLEKASPASGEIHAFPPVLIMAGEGEILLDDSRNFYNKIKAVQSRSKLTVYPGQTHVWPLSDINSEGARKAIQEINDFLIAG